MRTTFIYALLHNDEVRYIGKANIPKRRFRVHLKDKSDCPKSKWMQNLLLSGESPEMEIIDEVPLNEWIFWEQHYISLYKSWGFNLVNADNGGVGTGQLTQEALAKLSKASKGRKLSEDARRKISESNRRRKLNPDSPFLNYWKGRKQSDEHKTKRNIYIDRITDKAREAALKANVGRKLTEEHKAKISAIGRKHSEETKAKIGLKTKERMSTPEAREMIRQVQKQRWQKIKGLVSI